MQIGKGMTTLAPSLIYPTGKAHNSSKTSQVKRVDSNMSIIGI